MDVISTCPLRVASLLWQPRRGAFALTIVCKATFTLEPGTSPFTGIQDDPQARDLTWDEVPGASIRRATDLVPFKRRPEVLLVGHAYAPGGHAVPRLVARLVVGDVDKALAVHGDRWIHADGRITETPRFVRAPLRWERAAGGPGTSNPIGMRLEAPTLRGPVAVPNLIPPHVQITSWRDVIPPACFGPLSPTWPDRVGKLYHHAGSWDHERWAAAPLPEGMDGGYFNAAPADQQTGEIRADERIVLEHLHPRHPRLVTNLQPLEPRVVAQLEGAPEQVLRLRRDTLSIDTDRGTASLVWRTNMVLAHPQQSGRVVVTLDDGAAPAWIARLDAARGELAGTMPLDSALALPAATLPFNAAPTPAILPPVVRAPAKLAGTTVLDPAATPSGPSLPFVNAPDSSTPAAALLPPVTAAPSALTGTMSIDHAVGQHGPVLPFARSTAAPAEAAVPALRWLLLSGDVDPGAPQHVNVRSEPMPGSPSPPPMLGPIAGPPRPDEPGGGPAAAPAHGAEIPEPPAPLRLEDYPVERCGRIAASCARPRGNRFAALDQHDLTEETWQTVERHWAEAIRAEGARGKATLLRAYDAAYVEQLEAERGKITAREHARLVVATERGKLDGAAIELDIPPGAFMQIRRTWITRCATDASLAAEARRALEAERDR